MVVNDDCAVDLWGPVQVQALGQGPNYWISTRHCWSNRNEELAVARHHLCQRSRFMVFPAGISMKLIEK